MDATEVGRTRTHYVLAVLMAGAAAIHFATAPAHFGESTLLGVGFVVAGWIQLTLAVAMVARPSRRALAGGVVVNAGVLGLWLLSRTVGIPSVHGGEPEAIAFIDLTSAVLEAAFVVGAGALLLGYRPIVAARLRPAGAVAIAGAIALTSVALAAPASERGHADTAEHEVTAQHEHDVSGVVDDHGSHDETMAAAGSGGHHHAECAEPVTTDQQATADAFITASNATVAKYADFAVAQAEGWQPITPEATSLVHYGKWDRMADGRIFDPEYPESLIYAFGPDRTPYFLGAMYLTEGIDEPPQPAGCAMTWHNHENLCIAPGRGMVGVVRGDGTCAEGSKNVATSYMLHAWSIPMSGGPFSEIDPQAVRQAVIDAYVT